MSTLKQTKRIYSKWLVFAHDWVVDALLATIAAHRLESDPVWMFWVDASGGTKTELLRSLASLPDVKLQSSLTAHTLISGFRVGEGKADPSLLPTLDGKVLIINDFTSILSLPSAERNQIFGQLREAYSGFVDPGWGTGKRPHYKARFGLVAGVVRAIEHYMQAQRMLGERFLHIRPSEDTVEFRRQCAKKAQDNRPHLNEMRAELLKASASFMETLKIERPAVSEATKETVLDLAEFIAVLRAPVQRDGYTNEVLYMPDPEHATRLSQQLTNFAEAVSIVRSKQVVSEEEIVILRRVAHDTIPSRRLDVITALWEFAQRDKSEVSSVDVAQVTRFPTNSATRCLGELRLLRIVDRSGETNRYAWQMTEWGTGLLRATGLFTER